MKSAEHDHQKFVFDILGLNEDEHPDLKWVYAIPNGSARHPAVAGKLKAEGVRRGIYDVCIPIPRHGYHGAYIELKIKPNKLTAEQVAFGAFARGYGYFTQTAWTGDEMLDAIEGYLGLKLRGRK